MKLRWRTFRSELEMEPQCLLPQLAQRELGLALKQAEIRLYPEHLILNLYFVDPAHKYTKTDWEDDRAIYLTISLLYGRRGIDIPVDPIAFHYYFRHHGQAYLELLTEEEIEELERDREELVKRFDKALRNYIRDIEQTLNVHVEIVDREVEDPYSS